MRIIRYFVLMSSAFALWSSPLAAATAVHVGALTCNTGPSVGLLIGSQQRMNCVFISRTGVRESYAGQIDRLGLDVGVTAGGRLVWRVYAPTSSMARHALAGNYVGGSANFKTANYGTGMGSRTITLPGKASVMSAGGFGVHQFAVTP